MPTDREFLATLTVLHVEDDGASRLQASRFLGKRVAKVVVAADGVEGVECFRAHHPDIVVTDILMPGMDGLQMAEEIRQISPKTPLVILTAFDNLQFMHRSMDIGIDRYVLKPVDGDALDKALLQCARALRGERELEALARKEDELREARHQESMSILAGGMAHDFNNLLQALVSAAFLAKSASESGASSDQFFRLIDAVYVQIKELSERLILLDPNNAAERQLSEVQPLLRECLAREVAGTRCSLVLDLPGDLPQAPFNADHLGKVFSNLARNAVEAMDGAGTLAVSADVRRVEADSSLHLDPGSYLHISFTDSGRGIPPERLGIIFEPYASTKPRGNVKGQGLGLTLCKAIMRLHHGSVTVVSTPGRGSTFHLHLPVRDA